MAKQTLNYQPRGYNLEATTFVNADGTTTKDVLTAGTWDSVIIGLTITSDDTVARAVQLFAYNGSTNYVIATINIPAASGTDGTAPAVDGLASDFLPLDGSGKKVLPLKGGWKLRAKLLVAAASGKTVTVTGIAKDF